MVKCLAKILCSAELQDGNTLVLGFETLNALIDSSVLVHDELLGLSQVNTLYTRSIELGMRLGVQNFEHIFPRLYFATTVFGHYIRAHQLCVKDISRLCLSAAGFM